jgi:hypothetical protein
MEPSFIHRLVNITPVPWHCQPRNILGAVRWFNRSQSSCNHSLPARSLLAWPRQSASSSQAGRSLSATVCSKSRPVVRACCWPSASRQFSIRRSATSRQPSLRRAHQRHRPGASLPRGGGYGVGGAAGEAGPDQWALPVAIGWRSGIRMQ